MRARRPAGGERSSGPPSLRSLRDLRAPLRTPRHHPYHTGAFPQVRVAGGVVLRVLLLASSNTADGRAHVIDRNRDLLRSFCCRAWLGEQPRAFATVESLREVQFSRTSERAVTPQAAAGRSQSGDAALKPQASMRRSRT